MCYQPVDGVWTPFHLIQNVFGRSGHGSDRCFENGFSLHREVPVSIALWSGVFVVGLALAVPSVVATVSAAATSDRGLAMEGYGSLVGLGAAAAPLLVAAMAPAGFSVLCLVLAAVLAVAAAVFAYGARR